MRYKNVKNVACLTAVLGPALCANKNLYNLQNKINRLNYILVKMLLKYRLKISVCLT